jgi:hypothetical protein
VTLKIIVFWVVTPCSLHFKNVSEEPAAYQQMKKAGFSEMLVPFQQTALSHIQQDSILHIIYNFLYISLIFRKWNVGVLT